MQTLTGTDKCELDRFILKKMLAAYGWLCDVNCTDDGQEVIELLSKNNADRNELPGIILLDIYIPGFDAWDFLKQLNWLYPTFAKPVEVYILSAAKNPADMIRAKQYAFVKAFILKPVTKEVIQKLRNQKKAVFSQFAILGEC